MTLLKDIGIVACVAFLPFAYAQEPSGPQSAAEAIPADEALTPLSDEEFARLKAEFDASLQYRTGEIRLPTAHVTLNVPEGYYFLDTTDARKVLEEAWGNPPDTNVDGMLFRVGVSALDEHAWGVVLTYEDTGYVSDEDAASIDYDMLIDVMRDGEPAENAQRKQMGFPAIKLIGWAAEPRYDAATHKMYWAKELEFEDIGPHTLNYDMRVLGRHGVLSLNFVAGMDQLGEVERAGPGILAIPHFDSGYRYEDFNAATDQKADFGVAGLIAGGAAAAALAKNTGILATVLLLLKKFWFVGVALVGGAFAGIRNLFTSKQTKVARKTEQRSATAFFDGPADAPSSEPAPEAGAVTPPDQPKA